MSKDRRNTEISYEWCQYTDDVKADLYTIRRIVKADHIKVLTQAEAEAFVRDNRP